MIVDGVLLLYFQPRRIDIDICKIVRGHKGPKGPYAHEHLNNAQQQGRWSLLKSAQHASGIWLFHAASSEWPKRHRAMLGTVTDGHYACISKDTKH